MKIEGYRLNKYNATYERTLLDVDVHKTQDAAIAIKIEDINTGIEFIFEFEKEKENRIYEQFNKIKKHNEKPRIRVWKKRDAQNNGGDSEQQGFEKRVHGTTITFGAKGRYQQLIHDAERYDKSMQGRDSAGGFSKGI